MSSRAPVVLPHSRLTERRELVIHADRWTDALAVDSGIVSTLLAQVEPDYLRHLDRATPPEEAVIVLVADDNVSVWLGETRLAVLPRDER